MCDDSEGADINLSGVCHPVSLERFRLPAHSVCIRRRARRDRGLARCLAGG